MKTISPLLFTALITANVPLLSGEPNTALFLQRDALITGAWWQFITHPFVHISTYHFLLDALAFLLLWQCRPMPRSIEGDVTLFSICYTGSLIGVWMAGIPADGFCGISGIAHGLMTFQGVNLILNVQETKNQRVIGAGLVITVAGKALIETLTGQVFLSNWHMGSVGIPITACHLGGTLAGGLYGLFRIVRNHFITIRMRGISNDFPNFA